MRSPFILRTALVVLLLVGAQALPAAAGGSDRRGSCDGGPSEWRLRVQREGDSSLRIRFQIEDGEPGQTWQLFLSDNGDRVFAGTKTSRDGGRVRVRRVTADRSDRDRISATGVNLDTGESCSASLTV
jgi:hypothetical protein